MASSSQTVSDMSAIQSFTLSPTLGQRRENDTESVSVSAAALAGRWHVIAASRGSISRNPQNVTETFEVSGTQLVSSLSFQRLGGSAATTRRRVFHMAADADLWSLIQTSLDIVFVDEKHAIVAEGRRLRILSRTPDISARDFFRRVSQSREKGYDADDLRMISTGLR